MRFMSAAGMVALPPLPPFAAPSLLVPPSSSVPVPADVVVPVLPPSPHATALARSPLKTMSEFRILGVIDRLPIGALEVPRGMLAPLCRQASDVPPLRLCRAAHSDDRRF